MRVLIRWIGKLLLFKQKYSWIKLRGLISFKREGNCHRVNFNRLELRNLKYKRVLLDSLILSLHLLWTVVIKQGIQAGKFLTLQVNKQKETSDISHRIYLKWKVHNIWAINLVKLVKFNWVMDYSLQRTNINWIRALVLTWDFLMVFNSKCLVIAG